MKKMTLTSRLTIQVIAGLVSLQCFAVPVSSDMSIMSKARALYQQGKLDDAIKTYSEVPKSSDFWTEAIEERAWASMRKQDYDKALADIQTLMAPTLSSFIGPEPYFLRGLAQLKTCDYAGIFKTIKLFKERYKDRTSELEKLAQTGKSPAADKAITLMSQGSVALSDLGVDVVHLPRLFHRDITLKNAVAQKKSGNSLAVSRMKALAKEEVAEISKNLKKMQVLEIEAIQRMYGNKGPYTPEKESGDVTADTLVFEQKGDEVWLDELDHYQVNAKGCPSKGESKL